MRQTLRNKWPEVIRPLAEQNDLFFPTGLSELDRIFPSGRGIPCGQLIEITGGASSGKTSLLFRLLGTPPLGVGSPQGSPRRRRIAYVDFSNALFPDTAIDLSRLLVIRPHQQVASVPVGKCRQASRPDGDGVGQRCPTPLKSDGALPLAVGSLPPTINGGPPGRAGAGSDATYSPLTSGLRAAELLLRDRQVEIVVFDLVGCRTPLPISLIHRLRLKTVRARGLVIFLTETTALIPSSMASLRLEVQRGDLADRYRITVTKSRLCAEGIRLEVAL